MNAQLRTALTSIGAASALMLLKLIAGVVAGSIGLISAGVESSGDVAAALLTFFAIRLAQRPADETHQYGHARAENLSALGEAAILVGGGAFILTEAISRLSHGGEPSDAAWYTFAVIGTALAVDVSRTLVSLRTAKRYGSAALRSNAFHFAGDLVGSVAVLIGLVFVRAGYPAADSVVALFVAGLVFSAASRLIWENANTLMDRVPASAEQELRSAIAQVGGGFALRRLRVREAGGRTFGDVVVAVPPAAALGQAHATADAIERAVQSALPDSDVVVHVEPDDEQQALPELVLAAALSVPRVREAHNIDVIQLDTGDLVSLHLKLPENLPLADAEPVVAAVTDAIRLRVPAVTDVRVHVEPLTEPTAAERVAAGAPDARAILSAIHEAVAGSDACSLTGEPELLTTDRGVVAFLTIALAGDVPLAHAHRVASELEEAIHERAGVADVVVTTVPVRTEPHP